MTTIVLILLILLLVGVLPTWPYSNGWGYRPKWGKFEVSGNHDRETLRRIRSLSHHASRH